MIINNTCLLEGPSNALAAYFLAGLMATAPFAAHSEVTHGPVATWHGDPATTMVLIWLDAADAGKDGAEQVWYREESGDWKTVKSAHHPFPKSDLTVRFAEIEGLAPDTRYGFTIRAQKPDGDPDRFFRTAPDKQPKKLRFVSGGDMYHERDWLDAMNKQAAKQAPLFALLGGDLAYGNNRDVKRWYDFIDSWVENCVHSDGLIIPMVVTIGNHETGGDGKTPFDKAQFYYSLFVLPRGEEKPWHTCDFGKYMSIFLIDSDHSVPIKGEQTEWLEDALDDRKQVPHKFACYHKPTFGTAKNPNLNVREHWVPLFERYRVTAAFEHDHHTYKRTVPIKQGIEHESGVVYLGDGAWGVATRSHTSWSLRKGQPITPELAWFFAQATPRRHLIRVDIEGPKRTYVAIDAEGIVFDSYSH